MYVRTRNPVAGIASASTSQYDTGNARNIKNHSARNGTTDVARSHMLRAMSGRA